MGKDAVEERERKPVRRQSRRPVGNADWSSANSALLIRAICSASKCGGALRFGYSRDGGAYAIGVYGDGEPYTDFVGSPEDIDATLEFYIELFDNGEGAAQAVSNPVKPPKLPVGARGA